LGLGRIRFINDLLGMFGIIPEVGFSHFGFIHCNCFLQVREVKETP
jgi:hypothetical protein